MMDMMSLLLAKLNQNVVGTPNQPNNGSEANTSNAPVGNGNGSNNGSNSGGSAPRPLQPVFLPREAQQAEMEIPLADEIRNNYMEYASLLGEIRDILTLDQLMK